MTGALSLEEVPFLARTGTGVYEDTVRAYPNITLNTMGVVPLLQREMCEIGIAINPSGTMARSPQGHVPTRPVL